MVNVVNTMVKRSYIKIVGPPILKAIKELEKIAVDMPEHCIMNTVISTAMPPQLARDVGGTPYNTPFPRDPILSTFSLNYYQASGVMLSKERCENIISRSVTSLGNYDFFFEWNKDFTHDELMILIGKIDESLGKLGCLYTIVTK